MQNIVEALQIFLDIVMSQHKHTTIPKQKEAKFGIIA